MGITEAAPQSSRKCEREDVEPRLKRRLNTMENHMGATEAAPQGARNCEREDVEPPIRAKIQWFFFGPCHYEKNYTT